MSGLGTAHEVKGMPELPEVETVRRGLQPAMEGARFRKGRGAAAAICAGPAQGFRRAAEGQTFEGLGRRASIFWPTSPRRRPADASRHVGSFRRAPRRQREAPPKRPPSITTRSQHLVHDMSSSTWPTVPSSRSTSPSLWLDEDHRARQARPEPLLLALGPEPLGNEIRSGMLARACKGKKTSLKDGTVRQKIVAGLATSMSARRCTARRVSPSAGRDDRQQIRLAERARGTIGRRHPRRGSRTRRRRGSSLRDHRRTDGENRALSAQFPVYDREGAAAPPGASAHQAHLPDGRSTFFCPVCQKITGRRLGRVASGRSRPSSRAMRDPNALRAAGREVGSREELDPTYDYCSAGRSCRPLRDGGGDLLVVLLVIITWLCLDAEPRERMKVAASACCRNFTVQWS